MSPLVIGLVIVATLIILSLSLYAGKLLATVRAQQQQAQQQRMQQQADIDKHNAYLIDSIQLIAKAVSEQQCELSEAAIRICRLLEKIYLARDENFPQQYPALHKLDTFLADYPTHEGYKALKKQERMRFDVKRAEKELSLKADIEAECKKLTNFLID